MNNQDVLEAIDSEIARLKQARALLTGDGEVAAPAKKSRKNAAKGPVAVKPAKKRQLSPEARKKIADAQKRRWAAQKAS